MSCRHTPVMYPISDACCCIHIKHDELDLLLDTPLTAFLCSLLALRTPTQVSAYYLLRGHALYYGGWISDAHVDYRKALQLDPGNMEARRLCRQFDSKGEIVGFNDLSLDKVVRLGECNLRKLICSAHVFSHERPEQVTTVST